MLRLRSFAAEFAVATSMEKLSSWAAPILAAIIAFLLSQLIGGIIWGTNLTSRVASLENLTGKAEGRLSALDATGSRSIPIIEFRLGVVEAEVATLRRMLDGLRGQSRPTPSSKEGEEK